MDYVENASNVEMVAGQMQMLGLPEIVSIHVCKQGCSTHVMSSGLEGRGVHMQAMNQGELSSAHALTVRYCNVMTAVTQCLEGASINSSKCPMPRMFDIPLP